ncbi:MAG: SIMPL domain-containing protein [Chloroflexi bacterium]|nr:SIMPL domain-containing protein [Chloroflexota bacterium]
MSRKWLLGVGILVASLAFFVAGCSRAKVEKAGGGVTVSTFGAQGADNFSIVPVPQQIGISVSGQGKVMATPDLALLQVGVEAKGPTVAKARDDAANAMDAVTKALKVNGVADKDIKTQQLSIYPYENRGPNGAITEKGYQVTNIVSAKIRDVQKAGLIVDAVTAAGGDLTRLDGISFTIEAPTQFQNQAREKAVADAKAKADQLAKLMGVKVGKPISITEAGNGGPIPFAIPAAKGLGMGGAETSVSPGETEITVNVSVTFAIE